MHNFLSWCSIYLHRLTRWWDLTNEFFQHTKAVKSFSSGKGDKSCMCILDYYLLIAWHWLKSFDLFRNNPTTISVDLQFGGLVNIGEYKQIVAGIIFEDAPRFRYLNNLGHLVGDLLVFYDSWEYILHGQYLLIIHLLMPTTPFRTGRPQDFSRPFYLAQFVPVLFILIILLGLNSVQHKVYFINSKNILWSDAVNRFLFVVY